MEIAGIILFSICVGVFFWKVRNNHLLIVDDPLDLNDPKDFH